MLNVAIAVDSVTDYGPEAVRVVAAACEEVIGEQRCPVASDLEPGTVAAWYAVVHPMDRDLSSVRIEFRDRTADGVLIEERSLTFSSRDTQESRLASVGSVIAALAAAREGSLARPRPREGAALPLPSPSPQRSTPWGEIPPPDWSVDVAALAVPSFGDGSNRWGGLGRARLGIYGRSFALVSARYATHPGNPSFSWWTLSAGVGTRTGERAATLNVEFSGELVFEHTNISAESGALRDSASEDSWGGRMGVDAVWATWQNCSVIFGVDGTLVRPRLHVVVGERDEARLPVATLGLMLGLRFQP